MAFWIALLLPCLMLAVAGFSSERFTTKAGVLGALGLLLVCIWLAIVMALAGSGAHPDAGWPASLEIAGGLLIGYGAIGCLSFRKWIAHGFARTRQRR